MVSKNPAVLPRCWKWLTARSKHCLFKFWKEKTMTEELKTVTMLDLKGLVCPIPIVKVSQAIKQVQVGETIEAIATDPGVLADIPAWCKTSHIELVKMEGVEMVFLFIVRRL